jgi:DNA-binding CsgD family transcriptional regulator
MRPSRQINDPPIIVGRDMEREQLRLLLEKCQTGQGSLVLVSGEAGIGKTALIDAMISDTRSQEILVLVGRCYDITTTPPYGPWVEILRTYTRDENLPELPTEIRDVAGLEHIGSQQQLFEIVVSFLSQIAEVCPLMIVLEDLHWADDASIQLLRFLGRQLGGLRVIIIASYRVDEVSRKHPLFALLPLLVREGHAERLELQPLSDEHVRLLVESRFPLSDVDIDKLTDFLVRHTEGNPLFIVELLRSIERDRAHTQATNGWMFANLEDIAPPQLLVQMIDRQIAGLAPTTRTALEVAAVLGHEIDIDLWQDVADIPDASVSSVIDEAIAARLIEPRGTAALHFRHALFREVLYKGMPFIKRRQVHQLAAEILLGAQSPDPDIVSHHFQRSGDPRAAHWLIRAGDRARRSQALATATERYEAALQLLEADPVRLLERGWLYLALASVSREAAGYKSVAASESARDVAAETGDEALVAWSTWSLGMSKFFVGQNGLSQMEAGLAAMRNLSEPALKKIPPTVQQFDTGYFDSSIAIIQSLFGNYHDALARAADVLRMPTPQDARTWNEWAHAESSCAHALCAFGYPEEARLALRRTHDAYLKAGNFWYAALNATYELDYLVLPFHADDPTLRQEVASRTESLWARASGQATRIPPRFGVLPLLVIEAAWQEARDLSLPFANRDVVYHYIALQALGVIAHAQGQPDVAWSMIKKAIPDGPDTQPGSIFAHSTLELFRLSAELALDAQDLSLASRWIQAHDAWLSWSGRIQGRAEEQILWARYHHLGGANDLARHHAEHALDFASNPRQPLALVPVCRFLGHLDTVEHRFESAQAQLERALTLAEACYAPYEQALTLLCLAELYASTGQPALAWENLDQVRAICGPLGAAPALQRATRIAARLGVRRGKSMFPAGLTAREVEVLSMVAKGMTDAETAERLFLSSRTVGSHLGSIYNKLGVNSRVAATRFAIQHGLAEPPSS